MSSSRKKITDFLVAVGTTTAVLVCGGLLVKNLWIEAEPRTLLCQHSGTGATGVAKRGVGLNVETEINYPSGRKEWGTIIVPYYAFTCELVFENGWTDVFSNND